MSMRMELSDLPPKYRAQAEAQIAARCRAKAPTLEAVAAAAKKTGREFDSRGEYDYYMGMILPKVQRGEIVKVESHRRFTMLPEKEYFLSLFVVVLPGGAGWMGSGRFTVRPVKVSGGGQIVYI